jgi:WD40 repeat protein
LAFGPRPARHPRRHLASSFASRNLVAPPRSSHVAGDYLASGSLGGRLHIWSTHTGTLLKSFRSSGYGGGSADIFEVAWNSRGTRLAATSTNAVTIIDVRMM